MIDRIDCMDLGRADMSMTRLLIHSLMYLYIYIVHARTQMHTYTQNNIHIDTDC